MTLTGIATKSPSSLLAVAMIVYAVGPGESLSSNTCVKLVASPAGVSVEPSPNQSSSRWRRPPSHPKVKVYVSPAATVASPEAGTCVTAWLTVTGTLAAGHEPPLSTAVAVTV